MIIWIKFKFLAGTPEFAVPTLKALIDDADFDVVPVSQETAVGRKRSDPRDKVLAQEIN